MMKHKIIQLILAVTFIVISIHPIHAMEVAITVDDLPASGNIPPNVTRMEIVKKMLAVFKKHHISGIYGLINGDKLNESYGIDVLKAWLD